MTNISNCELQAIVGGDLWTTVKCILQPWREVIDDFDCGGLR